MTIFQRWFGVHPQVAARIAGRQALCLLTGLLAGGASAQTTDTPYTFTTLAGRASLGCEDGPGSGARFAFPSDVAVDRIGNLYVADTTNDTIRKITPTGVVATLAGQAGLTGAADGLGEAARFNAPQGVAVDSFGTVYVADTGNDLIRKITPAGVVTTLAGLAGVSGSTDGLGSDARFALPVSVAVDSFGRVFATEDGSPRIRQIAPDGTVTTLTNLTGEPEDLAFQSLRGLAVDTGGNLLVADMLRERIVRITPTGVVTSLRTADGTVAWFERPQKLAIDAAGNVYAADSIRREVRRLTASGELTVFTKLPVALPPDYGEPPWPDGIAVDALGNVFVADTSNSAILRITPDGVLSTVAGFGPAFGSADGMGSAAQFFYPAGIALDASGVLYVADSASHLIRKIAADSAVTTLAGRPGGARFNYPTAVAVDPAGNVYVADTNNSMIRKITPDGMVTTFAGMEGTVGNADGPGTAATFRHPRSLAVDAAGNVYVADEHYYYTVPRQVTSAEIRKITPAGEVSTVVVLGQVLGIPVAPTAVSLAVDRAGTLYAAASDTATLYKVAPDGTVTVLAGPGASSDAASSPFVAPAAVTADANGNLFVADNHAIRRVTPDGVVTTVAGVADVLGSADGTGSAARFNAPSGIAVDAAGRLFVADTDNHTIRLGTTASVPIIVAQPQSQTVAAGEDVRFSVVVRGSPAPSLQWYRDGVAIVGATTDTLSLAAVQAADVGSYTVAATNDLGRVTSSAAQLALATDIPTPTAAGAGSGAISSWVATALLVLGAARAFASNRRRDRI